MIKFCKQIVPALLLSSVVIGAAEADTPMKMANATIRGESMPVIRVDDQPFNGLSPVTPLMAVGHRIPSAVIFS